MKLNKDRDNRVRCEKGELEKIVPSVPPESKEKFIIYNIYI